MGSEQKNWMEVEAVCRYESLKAYHAGKISAAEGARLLGVSLDTFLSHSKTTGPDLTGYKRVVLYVKDEEDESDEPRIVITENNLSHCMIHVSVIDPKAKTKREVQNSPRATPKRKNPEPITPRKQKAKKTIQHCIRPRVEADETLEMSPEPSASAYFSDDGASEVGSGEFVERGGSEEFTPSVPIPKNHNNMKQKDWKSSVELIQRIIGHDRLLSTRLGRNILAIRDDDAPIYRKYYVRHEQPNGVTSYMCSDCKLERGPKSDVPIPVIRLPSGDFDAGREHFCKGHSLVQMIATELDRCNRLQLSSGHEIDARKAWEQGRIRALELTQQFGFPVSGPDSITHHYPDFPKVSNQYYRFKRR